MNSNIVNHFFLLATPFGDKKSGPTQSQTEVTLNLPLIVKFSAKMFFYMQNILYLH